MAAGARDRERLPRDRVAGRASPSARRAWHASWPTAAPLASTPSIRERVARASRLQVERHFSADAAAGGAGSDAAAWDRQPRWRGRPRACGPDRQREPRRRSARSPAGLHASPHAGESVSPARLRSPQACGRARVRSISSARAARSSSGAAARSMCGTRCGSPPLEIAAISTRYRRQWPRLSSRTIALGTRPCYVEATIALHEAPYVRMKRRPRHVLDHV